MILPYQFRESSFRTYESIIASVVSAFPKTITLDSKRHFNLSPVTFACRFRDAMRSFAENNWSTDKINRDQFMKIHPNIAVSAIYEPGYLSIGDKVTLRRPSLLKISPVASLTQRTPVNSAGSSGAPYTGNSTNEGGETLVLELTHEAQFETLCQLAAARLLSNEVRFTSGKITIISLIEKYKDQFDISVDYDVQTGIGSII